MIYTLDGIQYRHPLGAETAEVQCTADGKPYVRASYDGVLYAMIPSGDGRGYIKKILLSKAQNFRLATY